MLEYRCYFLGADGRIVARREFQAAGDSEALIMARVFYAEHPTRDGFELWENKRRVHHERDGTEARDCCTPALRKS